MRISILALVSGAVGQSFQVAAGQSAQFLASNPGGAVPANVQAPSISGFMEPTIQPSRGGLAVCVSGMVPVTASSNNIKFNFTLPNNQSQVTQTPLADVTSGSPFTQQIMGGMHPVNGTYNISATFCTSTNNTKPTTVEILTHGVGFDRYYWDFAPGYSYVDVATPYNYETFFYDRLGIGQSSKPDALSVVQAPLEVEILQSLVTMIKSGYFSNSTFSTVIGTGHSFGSVLTQAVTSKYPTSFNTAILTGFSTNSTGQLIFTTGLNLAVASQNQPYRFTSLSNGYLVSSSAISNQIAFFHAPNFDAAILNLAEATKGTVTFGELFSLGSVIAPASNFTGSVAVVNGAEDLPFCTGNCSYPTNLAQAVFSTLYPDAKTTGAYLAPLTGHGFNLHYSAVAAYHYIQDFISNSTSA